MSHAVQQFLVMSGSTVALCLALFALRCSRRRWSRFHTPTDLALRLVAAFWLLHLLTTTTLNFAVDNFPSSPALQSYAGYAAQVGYQTLFVSVSFFLLTCAGLSSAWINSLLVAQAVLGAAILHWSLWPYWEQGLFTNSWSDPLHTGAYQLWIALNLLSALAVIGYVARHLYLTGSFKCWLALAAGLMGLGLCLDAILLLGQAHQFSTLSQCFYAAFLLVVWHLVKQPAQRPLSATELSHELASHSGPSGLIEVASAQAFAVSAVADERRRISQDLHDGVGSQIVSILATLDFHAPQQQAIALALEQCLVDLKMTVDAMDGANDNVLEALGRLRYRVQHSLDKLGIRMDWKIEICAQIEAVRGAQAIQTLRIAQESLANVMRHARATTVEVVCRFVADTNYMVLEIRDNGQGIPHGHSENPTGKGLEGMRQRAKEVGGELLILSKFGGGTCVRLTLPLGESRVWTRTLASVPTSISARIPMPQWPQRLGEFS